MPGIHFAEARARIALADVLDLLGFVPCESSGDQVRGPCPVHHSISPSSRSFSANLKRHIYRCFRCGSCGNQLDLYASATRLSLFEATVALCEQLHRDVPWMLNGTPLGPRSTDRYAPQPPSGREPSRRVGSIPEHGQTEGAIRKNRCLGAGFLFSHTPANNRRFPTLPSQGERPCPSANPANGDIQRRLHSNRGIASRRSGPRSRTSSSRSKPNAAMGA